MNRYGRFSAPKRLMNSVVGPDLAEPASTFDRGEDRGDQPDDPAFARANSQPSREAGHGWR